MHYKATDVISDSESIPVSITFKLDAYRLMSEEAVTIRLKTGSWPSAFLLLIDEDGNRSLKARSARRTACRSAEAWMQRRTVCRSCITAEAEPRVRGGRRFTTPAAPSVGVRRDSACACARYT